MKILILGLNYLPESTSIGPYTADLAEHLLRRGHDTRVITGFPTAPQWKVWKGYAGRRFMREVINGVPVERTWLHVPKDPRKTRQRILFDTSFAISSLWGALTHWSPELVFVVSPPLQLGVSGLLVGALRRARVFLHIQDLVPDAAVATGALHAEGGIAGMGRALERFVYRHADGIGVISEGMRRNVIAKGVAAGKIAVLPNYVDSEFIRGEASDGGFRSRFGIGADRFVAMYSGSVAGKQGLQTFVHAAAALADDAGITGCVIGDGPYLGQLQRLAAELSLTDFLFLPLQPRESLPSQLAAADVLVITQRKSVRDMVFPGKLLYYMAAARPIVAAVSEDSETGRFVADREVGMVVPPEDPVRLANAIRWLKAHPEAARRFGLNGRRVVESHFDRAVVLERIGAHLEQIVNNAGACPAGRPSELGRT